MTKKDTRLTFRVNSRLKGELERIAEQESESVARVCEAFLQAGLESYQKKGQSFLHRYVGILGKPVDLNAH
jgi:hypothetical protein